VGPALRGPHGRDLAPEPFVTDARPSSRPSGRITAEQRRAHRGGSGRVPDAHLAEDEQIGAVVHGGFDGRPAGCDARFEPGVRQRRLDPDVPGRSADPDVDGEEARPQRARHRRGGRSSSLECGEHRLRHPGRVGAHADRGDTVIGREHDRRGTIDRRPGRALPTREPGRELVEPSQGSTRSKDRGRPSLDHEPRGCVGPGEVDQHLGERVHPNSSAVSMTGSGIARPATTSQARSARATNSAFTRPSTSR